MKIDTPKEDLPLETKFQLLQRKFEALEAIVLKKEKEENFLSQQLAESVDSVIGLREALETKHPCLKFTWSLLFLAGVALTGYFMYATIEEYMANPTLTKVDLDTKAYYEYPPFVLCTTAWFNASKAAQLGLSSDGFRYSLGYLNQRYTPLDPLNNSSEARKNFEEAFHEHGFKTLADFYMYVATHFEATKSKDDFYGTSGPAYFIEDHSKGETSLIYGGGGWICHSFKFQPLDGKSGSLIRAVSIHVKYGVEVGQWFLFFAEGASSKYSFPLIVPSAARNNLRIQAQVFNNLNTPNNPCVENPVDGYLSADCMADCQEDFYKNKFGCHEYFGVTDQRKQQAPKEFCNFFDLFEGNSSARAIHLLKLQNLATEATDICFSQCPRVCKRMIYEASLQGVDKAHNWFYAEEEDKRVRSWNMSVTSFSILHDAIRQGGIVTFTELSSYSFVALASNVGGTLGLFVGGALMTFAQLALFLVRIFGGARKKN